MRMTQPTNRLQEVNAVTASHTVSKEKKRNQFRMRIALVQRVTQSTRTTSKQLARHAVNAFRSQPLYHQQQDLGVSLRENTRRSHTPSASAQRDTQLMWTTYRWLVRNVVSATHCQPQKHQRSHQPPK